ncbi:MAG: 4-hydroxy-tetrahydrodipicolinate reductase, partial [Bacteroides sp. SM23_62]
WVLQQSGRDEDLWINAIRAGSVTGVHEVLYESAFDSLSIKHSAKDRRGFATGALMAAEFIENKKGFFTMKDVLGL